MSWPWLPVDVYVHILSQLPISADADDSSTRALFNCCQANSQIRAAAILPSVWEPHYRARYKLAVPEREAARKEKHSNDWRMMYHDRRRIDYLAVKLLDEIIERRSGRISRAREFISLSFDVWNALDCEARCAVPDIFHKQGDTPGVNIEPASYALTRRYWAKNIQGIIARHHTITLWAQPRLQGPDGVLSFEEVLAGLSAFFGYTSSEIIAQLDSLALQCRTYLIAAGHSFADLDNVRLPAICTNICAFLRSEGYGAAGQNFHHLFNHFPHRFLSTHRRTIPLSLVYIFVSIARRLGISASPTNFPDRVMAHVSSANPEVSDIYIDVYGSSTKPVLSARDDVPPLLLRAGIPPGSILRYIAPCPAAPMLLRAARNILSSLRMLPQDPQDADGVSEADCQAAMYASYCVHILLTHDNQVFHLTVNHLSDFPLDQGPILHDTLAPLLQPRRAQVLLDGCKDAMTAEEAMARAQNKRSGTAQHVKYFVGMIFQHAILGYLGCIKGWEPKCLASEDWVIQMDVDSLPRGRDQPFYHIFSLTGPPNRYVAEENIRPHRLTPAIARDIVDAIPQVSRYFDGVELRENGWGWMHPSPESLSTYPDDDAVANAWIFPHGDE